MGDGISTSTAGAALVPRDAALPGMAALFDADWYTLLFDRLYPEIDGDVEAIGARRLTYRPGQRALVSYVASQRFDDWVLDHEFAAEILAGEPEPRVFRYPDDPYLPGLAQAASAVDGDDLLREHVGLRSNRLRVRPVRYRPSTRAVLRYTARLRRGPERKVVLFARAMRPKTMPRFVAAGMLADRSLFRVPALAGSWDEGGVVWLAAMPGETVRRHIMAGDAPGPEVVLEYLASLWSLDAPEGMAASDLPHALRFTRRFLAQILRGHPALRTLGEILVALQPLADGWRPEGVAHNDFYDDQLIVLPNDALGLVDFEECAPGDQMLDVANMLAHLRWSARFLGSAPSAAYHDGLRAAALGRFRWDERALDMRESFALLRLATNPVRTLAPDWREVTEQALQLARAPLEGAAAAEASAA
jgi:aminoglycoside phosphotransferase (APT) family kinase protein